MQTRKGDISIRQEGFEIGAVGELAVSDKPEVRFKLRGRILACECSSLPWSQT